MVLFMFIMFKYLQANGGRIRNEELSLSPLIFSPLRRSTFNGAEGGQAWWIMYKRQRLPRRSPSLHAKRKLCVCVCVCVCEKGKGGRMEGREMVQ